MQGSYYSGVRVFISWSCVVGLADVTDWRSLPWTLGLLVMSNYSLLGQLLHKHTIPTRVSGALGQTNRKYLIIAHPNRYLGILHMQVQWSHK